MLCILSRALNFNTVLLNRFSLWCLGKLSSIYSISFYVKNKKGSPPSIVKVTHTHFSKSEKSNWKN